MYNLFLVLFSIFVLGDFPQQLLNLWRACHHVQDLEEAISNAGLVSRENQSLHALERNLLDMAGSDVIQGLIFMLVLSFDGAQVIRFLEAGSFVGFVHKTGRQVLWKRDAHFN